jgi:hypothetical protein
MASISIGSGDSMTADLDRIRTDVEQRGVSRLCHFTQSRKLHHILAETHAILPTADLQRDHPDLLDVTDHRRFDGRLDHVCCSLEYPNVWYFDRVRGKDPNFDGWVILAISPRIIWERQALFCPRNAATANGALLRAGWDGWQALFAQSTTGARRTYYRTARYPSSCPTDCQAEVLIPGPIPLAAISAIIVPSQEALAQEWARLRALDLRVRVEWRVAPGLFRQDYRTYLDTGQRPQETVVSEPVED